MNYLVRPIYPFLPDRPLKGWMPNLRRSAKRGSPRGGQVKRVLAFLRRIEEAHDGNQATHL